jgi:hypothetical protein
VGCRVVKHIYCLTHCAQDVDSSFEVLCVYGGGGGGRERIQNGSSRKGATASCLRRTEGINWINVAWERDNCGGFVKSVMNIRVSYNGRYSDA